MERGTGAYYSFLMICSVHDLGFYFQIREVGVYLNMNIY